MLKLNLQGHYLESLIITLFAVEKFSSNRILSSSAVAEEEVPGKKSKREKSKFIVANNEYFCEILMWYYVFDTKTKFTLFCSSS